MDGGWVGVCGSHAGGKVQRVFPFAKWEQLIQLEETVGDKGSDGGPGSSYSAGNRTHGPTEVPQSSIDLVEFYRLGVFD